MTPSRQIRSLIHRLARLDAAGMWDDALNPAQSAALDYLGRANRFSRAPSHVAEYLGTTRGTMSQTLKALVRKGYLRERPSETDRRSISYDLTRDGTAFLARENALADAIADLPESVCTQLGETLAGLLARQVRRNSGRPFGVCKTCCHHRAGDDGAFCSLLALPLSDAETEDICHEHALPA